MGTSTHTFKNCGYYNTHSTHTNKDPAWHFLVEENLIMDLI